MLAQVSPVGQDLSLWSLCQKMGDEIGDPQSFLRPQWEKERELICIKHLLCARSFHILSYESLEPMGEQYQPHLQMRN